MSIRVSDGVEIAENLEAGISLGEVTSSITDATEYPQVTLHALEREPNKQRLSATLPELPNSKDKQ